MSRRTGGRPGDRIDGRPVKVTIHPGPRPKNHLLIEVLRRPVETAQYGAVRYAERLALEGAVASVGSRGHSYDKAMAEAFDSLFKAELIRNPHLPNHDGPWRGIDDVEIAVADGGTSRLRGNIDWYSHRRLHGELGMIPPTEHEAHLTNQLTSTS